MNLWHIRLGGNSASLLEKQFRADLANNHSLITIGYSLSKDVSELSEEKTRLQLESDNPHDENKMTIKSYNMTIGQNLRYIRNFKKGIQPDDYAIALFQHPRKEYRIGKFIGKIGTIRSLLDISTESFAKNYESIHDVDEHGNKFIAKNQSESLARKIKWIRHQSHEEQIIEKVKGEVRIAGLKYTGTVVPTNTSY